MCELYSDLLMYAYIFWCKLLSVSSVSCVLVGPPFPNYLRVCPFSGYWIHISTFIFSFFCSLSLRTSSPASGRKCSGLCPYEPAIGRLSLPFQGTRKSLSALHSLLLQRLELFKSQGLNGVNPCVQDTLSSCGQGD